MIGRTLGRYRIVERLGEGGAGTVYRAEDPRLERDVAIKVLHAHALDDENARRRFRREARALSRLLHPNIATLFDLDVEGAVDFIVLEYVPGETLARTLDGGPLPEARARAIALELADAPESANPFAPARTAFPTAGDFVAYLLTGHLAYHLGQLVAWRATAGLGRLQRPDALAA